MTFITNYRPSKKPRGMSFDPETRITEPGRSLTPKQILERFQSGRPMGHIPGYYEFNGDRTGLIKNFPDISRYDFHDQIEYYNTLREELNTLKNELLKGSTKSLENTLIDKIAEVQDKLDNPQNYDKDPTNDTE